MAKRYKEDEEDDDIDIDMEFDKEEYMKDEIIKGKSTLIAVALAPIFGVVSWFVFTLTEDAFISLFAGLIGVAMFKPIYQMFNIDIDKLGKKSWIKNFGVFFLTLLAVWIILMNPPFSNFADPEVTDVSMEIEVDGEWVSLEDVENKTEGDSFSGRVVAEITDNREVDEESVEIRVDRGNWESMNKTNDHIYQYELSNVSVGEEYTIEIVAEDIDGNSTDVELEISIEADDEDDDEE